MNATIEPGPRLRLRIQLDSNRILSRPTLASDISDAKPERESIVFKFGPREVRFPLWQSKTKHGRRVYRDFVSEYSDGLKTHRVKRSTKSKLRLFLEGKAIAQENGETARLQLTPADQAKHVWAESKARQLGVSFEQLITLGEQALLAERSRAKFVHKTCPETVADFLEKLKAGAKWKRVLKKMLDRFAEHFTGPLASLDCTSLDDWLDRLKDKKGKALGLRSRKNYFDAITAVFRFAVTRGYAPRDWNPMDGVSNPELPRVKINIYTPQALAALLNFAESYEAGSKLVPLIAITAFAGVRHGEMNEEKLEHLDWKNVRFKTKRIIIGEDESKTGTARVVDMPDNLVEWLLPYRRNSGKICVLKNTSNALCELRKKCAAFVLAESAKCANRKRAEELQAIADELSGPKKNALRKSFISYKKALTGDIEAVADQAGNSPGVIRKHYLHVDEEMKEEAERWFAILPTRADVLPLFSWTKSA